MNSTPKMSQVLVRSPLLWGGLASFGFYTLIHTGTLQGVFFERYFCAHWTLYVEVIAFFVGLAGLLIKGLSIGGETARLSLAILPEAPAHAADDDCDTAQTLLEHLGQQPARLQQGYLPQRLRESLESVLRKGNAETLDSELKYLSDVDANRAHAAGALLRLIIWAIPILGFLGTVIGITIAISSLSPQAMEESLLAVTGGLGVAFDTTALALVLSALLMFGQYMVDKREQRLLEAVDAIAADEMAGRFAAIATGGDPQVMAVRRMSEAVVKATERLVERQAEVWRASMENMAQRYAQMMAGTQQQLEAALAGALSQGLQGHVAQWASIEQQTAEKNREHWGQLQQALLHNASAMQAQQAELTQQGEVLLRVVDATGQVTRLEDSLNQNLATLAGSHQFEETLLNLSAAIHLLNARIGHSVSGKSVELHANPSVGRAA